uniref:Uncharacterized protein n=1 Tax=Cacopsylla melanoneura TaxID=428564 RepID=A0A8D8WGX7_9HEMI
MTLELKSSKGLGAELILFLISWDWGGERRLLWVISEELEEPTFIEKEEDEGMELTPEVRGITRLGIGADGSRTVDTKAGKSFLPRARAGRLWESREEKALGEAFRGKMRQASWKERGLETMRFLILDWRLNSGQSCLEEGQWASWQLQQNFLLQLWSFISPGITSEQNLHLGTGERHRAFV